MLVPQLDTVRLRLRGHECSDFKASAAMWADETVVRHITGIPSSQTESWSRLLRYIGHWQALKFGYWVVEDRQTGLFLGEVGFADYKRDIEPSLEGTPEIGWVMTREASGRGLATEAVSAAVHWGDENLDCKVTTCIFDPDHRASIRVGEKNGYTKKVMATLAGQPTLIMERPKVANLTA